MKSEVYSWRVSTALKADLEREARRLHMPLSKALDLATRQWLDKTSAAEDNGERQAQLREALLASIGVLASGRADRSANTRQLVRERLQSRRDR
jgi:hypothetical protein